MKLWGLDEAGLGPRLGPFVATLTLFELKNQRDSSLYPFSELYPALVRHVTRKPDGTERLVINDSKKIYNPPFGMATLEKSVLTLLAATDSKPPQTFAQFLRLLCLPEDLLTIASVPWFADADKLFLPWASEKINFKEIANSIVAQFSSVGLRILPPRLRLVPAENFNKAIHKHGGKSKAVQHLLAPLFHQVLEKRKNPLQKERKKSLDDNHKKTSMPDCRLTVDRQGGRCYYATWLCDIYDHKPIKTKKEGKNCSLYEMEGTPIEFLVSADSKRLEVAVASMFAKYARESAMRLFNHWWVSRLPSLRPTAGYPQDAQRFLNDLEKAHLLPKNLDQLVRIL